MMLHRVQSILSIVLSAVRFVAPSAIASTAALSMLVSAARAQEMQPPLLARSAELDCPPDVVRTEVKLLLTIDTTGRVIDSVISDSGGEPVDRLAVEAAARLRFAPATVDGEAIIARVPWSARCRREIERGLVGQADPAEDTRGPEDASSPAREPQAIPAETTSGEETQTDSEFAEIVGRLTVNTEYPWSGAVGIIATHESGLGLETQADAEGRFRFESVPIGTVHLQASTEALHGERVVELQAGARRHVEIQLEATQRSVDITAQDVSAAERARRSAEAVSVVDTTQSQSETADLGEVATRSEGLQIQREGGLGSSARISLNGLTDDQIRVFLDDVPLEFTAFSLGLSNVPVSFVEHLEIYRGVVPIRFGADALGGALVLASPTIRVGAHGGASYQGGSFDSHRATLSASYRDPDSGWYVSGRGFFDRAENDYVISAPVPTRGGSAERRAVHHFHNAYLAGGGIFELGVRSTEYAEQLSLQLFGSLFEREIPHGAYDEVPFGDVFYSHANAGATLRYRHGFDSQWALSVSSGYRYRETRSIDEGRCRYLWTGICTFERTVGGGEVNNEPRDIRIDEHAWFARTELRWRPFDEHVLRLSLSPTYMQRTGRNRAQPEFGPLDPLGGERVVFDWIAGLEYQPTFGDGRVEAILFVKQYFQLVDGSEALPSGSYGHVSRSTHDPGAGAQARVTLVPGLYAKASYEWATRLPRADELFGNGLFIIQNLDLSRETSHNVNLGVTGESDFGAAWGEFRGTLNGFLRLSSSLIYLQPGNAAFYDNVGSSQGLGLETAIGWTSPCEYVALELNATYQDVRNTSESGPFAQFEGDRIPALPYLFGTGRMMLQLSSLFRARDRLFASWTSRFVESFYYNWESAGDLATKSSIPAQFVHTAAVGYEVALDPGAFGITLEIANLTDELAFDFFRRQRPGRSFAAKLRAEF